MTTLWHRFSASPVGELLTGRALQAHPTDLTAPLGVRFAGQTVLAIHVALEKAATVRIAFDGEGRPHLSGIRNIRQRATTEFADVIRSEVAATRASWAVVVFATGWQAVLGQRSARSEPHETTATYARHRLMFETPEVVVSRAQVDRVYTAVDHPVLDKSVVFSLRRKDVEEVAAELRRCGVGIAAAKIAVAAQLEVWLAQQGERATDTDLLLTDGLSALLLNAEQGDFVPPRGAVEAELPRQSVQRPSAIEEDIARFVRANGGRAVTFVGPEEVCAAVKRSVPDAQIVRPPQHAAHKTELVALHPRVAHDLNAEAREVRPAIPPSWRRTAIAGMAATLLLMIAALGYGVQAVRVWLACYELEREAARHQADAAGDERRAAEMASALVEATALRTWVGGNYHAQRFTYGVLRGIPANAALDRLLLELRDGQITLTFIVLGDQDTQLATHRAVERAIKDLHYKIGGEELPTSTSGPNRAVQYRLHLIVPDAGDSAA